MRDFINKLTWALYGAQKTIDEHLMKRFTIGSTLVDGKWMYLDRKKYKGKGRPKKSDYKEIQTSYTEEI